jgi:teichuronic acid exporter
MNLGDRIRSGVRWLLVGNIGGQFLQFAFGVVLARLLVPAEFGMVVTMQVLTGFVGMFASGGMGQSLIRAKDVDADDFNAVFTMQLSLGVLIYLGFFVSAPWVATFFKDPVYSNLLRVSALSFVMRPFSLIRIAWLSREMDFKKRSLIDLLGGIVAGVSSVLMAAAGMGVWSLTVSGLVGAAVATLLLTYATPLRLRLRFDFESSRRHSAYGFKTTANDFLTYLIEQSVNLILSRLAGPGLVGLFNKAESLARMPNRLLTPPTGQTVFRAMSKVQDDLDQTKYLFYRTITLLMVYIFPFLIGLWWIAEPFVRLVYGEKWEPCVEPMRIMILIGFLRTLATPCGVLLAAQNRLNQQMIAQTASLATTIVACLIGLNWGLQGVAWAAVGTATIFTAYAYVLVYRTIPTRVEELLRAATPALMLSAILFAILAVVQISFGEARTRAPWTYLSAMVVAGSLTYACAFLFLPIPGLRAEVLRWREGIARGLSFLRNPRA